MLSFDCFEFPWDVLLAVSFDWVEFLWVMFCWMPQFPALRTSICITTTLAAAWRGAAAGMEGRWSQKGYAHIPVAQIIDQPGGTKC